MTPGNRGELGSLLNLIALITEHSTGALLWRASPKVAADRVQFGLLLTDGIAIAVLGVIPKKHGRQPLLNSKTGAVLLQVTPE